MADANLQAVLQAHGITASPRQLAEYLAEAVAAMEEGALIPAVRELPEAELEVLRSGGFDVDAGPSEQEDPIARASAAYSALMETALTIKAVAAALGRNESRIRQRLLQRSLYGIRRGRGWLLPLFQFQVEEREGTRTVKGVVPGIEQVIPALSPELHPVSVWRWFTSPSTELTEDAAPVGPENSSVERSRGCGRVGGRVNHREGRRRRAPGWCEAGRLGVNGSDGGEPIRCGRSGLAREGCFAEQ